MAGRPEGFRETDHTADWELHAWAEDISGLFRQAARGMYSLSGVVLEDEAGGRRFTQAIELHAPDLETLLVSFLSELLAIGEDQGVGFDQFDLQVAGLSLAGTLAGAAIIRQDKEIKAVTFHNLQIRHDMDRVEVNIVFDV